MMSHKKDIEQQRSELLLHFTRLTDKFMVSLAFVWTGLMIADFTGKTNASLDLLNYVIWGIFIADFLIKFTLAPRKGFFLRHHWLTLVSLLLPAFRVVRIFRALSSLRTLSMVRVLTSFNRSMSSLAASMGRRGVGYIIVLTIVVLFGGAAGMYQFEKADPVLNNETGFVNYSDAVWWTAMLMTTIGSQYWPVTIAGRFLCFLISLFSLGVFGYITATLASFFIDGSEPKNPGADQVIATDDLHELRKEIADLKSLLQQRHI